MTFPLLDSTIRPSLRYEVILTTRWGVLCGMGRYGLLRLKSQADSALLLTPPIPRPPIWATQLPLSKKRQGFPRLCHPLSKSAGALWGDLPLAIVSSTAGCHDQSQRQTLRLGNVNKRGVYRLLRNAEKAIGTVTACAIALTETLLKWTVDANAVCQIADSSTLLVT